MLIRHLSLTPFFDKEAAPAGGGAPESDDSLSRDLADLEDDSAADDDESADEKDEKELESSEEDDSDDSDDDKTDEEAEPEEKDEKDDEEEEERQASDSDRPTVKAIKEKYPNLFKDFPALKTAFFRDSKFLEVFADPQAASEAATKAENYDLLERGLIEGDPKLLLSELHENNPKALREVVKNIPSVLRELSQADYIALATPIVEDLLYYAKDHGLKNKDKNLELSAKHIARFFFANDGEVPDITKREGAKKHPAEEELNRERSERAQEKFQAAAISIRDSVKPDLDAVLSNKLDDLTLFEKRSVMKETQAELDEKLQEDRSFQSVLNSLWRKAADNNYDQASMSRIKKAWMEKARTIAPGIRNRLKQEALDARSDKGEKKQEGKKRTFQNAGGRAPGSRREVLDPHKIDWRKTSDADILSDDTSRVALKK